MKVTVIWDTEDTDLENATPEVFHEQTAIPPVIELPKEIVEEYRELAADDEDDADDLISDWLSDEYGWLHYGWIEVLSRHQET